MKTHFAPAERATPERLRQDIEHVAKSPVVDAVLRAGGGLIAVLNRERQVLAVNTSLLDALGCPDASTVLGLRPGEAVGCVQADTAEGGCGTTEMCATCGAAIAIVTAMAEHMPVERLCAIEASRGGVRSDLFFRVRAVPFVMGDTGVLLVFLQDVTQQQKWAATERLFFHDISNVIMGLMGECAELAAAASTELSGVAREAFRMSNRLAREISIQRELSLSAASSYQPVRQPVSLARIAEDVRRMFAHHRAAEGKTLTVGAAPSDVTLETDPTLVLRVLGNMVTNAFEATEPGGEVRVSVAREPERVMFSVWNAATIPEPVQRRIFQRNFSTKDEMGRGLGTYSMKLFGEQALGGQVSFTSDASGTVFRLSLEALRPAADRATSEPRDRSPG